MAIAPLLHQRMTLSERCEVGLAAFVSLDLFAILSKDVERRQHLPNGAAFLAKQTREALQACALSAAAIALGKNEDWEPWHRGHARLSEISIEQWFGSLRCQHSNAQMSLRQYFMSSARQMLKTHKALNEVRPVQRDSVKPLTAREPLDCIFSPWCSSVLFWVWSYLHEDICAHE